MAATVMFPLDVWTSQITQASIPANANALRVEVLDRSAVAIASAQPASPTEGQIYILGAAPSGAQWSTFAQHQVVIYKSGTWLAYAPFEGWIKSLLSGQVYIYQSGAWALLTVSAAPSPPVVVSVTASKTLGNAERYNWVEATHATVPIVLTVPTDATTTWSDSTEIHIRMGGAAQVSIAAAAGVTITYPASQTLLLRERYAVATLKRVGADSWALFGLLKEL